MSRRLTPSTGTITIRPDRERPAHRAYGSHHPLARGTGQEGFEQLQPRLGFAWTFHPKFVFRSSFGITHSDLFVNGLNQNFEEYQATASIQAPVGDPSHVFRLSEGPPAYAFNVARDGSVPFVGTNYSGRNASWYDPNMRLPYVATWSGGIQYQVSNSVLVEARYQGSAGVGC